MSDVPNPGSIAAIEKGCTCPIHDNCNGAGIIVNGKSFFWHTAGCPVHCPEPSPLPTVEQEEEQS